MKLLTTYLIFLILLASCSTAPEEKEIREPKLYTIEQFQDTDQIFGSSFSSDESKVLVTSNETGIFNAYEIDLATGAKKALTQSETSAIIASSYFPDDDRFIYTSDHEGDELTSIFIQGEDGTSTNITPDSTSRSIYAGWNHNRDKFYYLSNARDPRFMDMYQVSITSETESGLSNATEIYRNQDGLTPYARSEDGRYLALVRIYTRNNQDMYLLDTESGETKLISEHDGDVQFSPEFFSVDGRELYYTTDEDSEFMYLKSYSIEDGSSRIVQKEDWDILYSYTSHSGKYRVTAINMDASTKIEIINTTDGSALSLPALPEGDITSVNISESERLMTFYVSSSRSPNNLYLLDLETKELKQLTETLNPDINPDDLVEGEVIRYASFDGLEIPAILYTPQTASADNKVPVMLWIHGGPGGQTRLNYTVPIQYLVNHGYAVLAVNNRGSTGYGKSFEQADNQRHGDVDLRDCIEAKKYLATLDFVDTDKIGIMGGSYGGYMVMAALTFAPEEFDLGVNIFGVTNWLRTLKNIPPWWTAQKDALYNEMGDPVKDSVLLYNQSPLFHASRITKPFIVFQGANDPRVLQVESDEIVEAARANGADVEYVVFEDEGHGFAKKENQAIVLKRVLEFLDARFKNRETTAEAQ